MATKTKRGPKGIVAARKYFKEHKVVSFEELHDNITIDLKEQELQDVIRYLNDNHEIAIKYGLRNCFPETPIYDEKEAVPVNTQIENYYINEDCIIPLYVRIS